MLSHTVLFRLRRPVDPQQLAAFITELRTFAAQAPPSAGPITIGANIGIRDPADARVADVSLVTTFADADDFAAYVDHPRHRAIVTELLKPTCESWLTLQAEA